MNGSDILNLQVNLTMMAFPDLKIPDIYSHLSWGHYQWVIATVQWISELKVTKTVLFWIMQPGYNRKPCLKLRKKQQWNNLFPFFIVSHLFCNFIGVRKGWNWGEGWWWEHVGMTFVNGNTRCNALIDQLR